MKTLDLSILDPGIADVVARLRAMGFNTTDSGDGASKGEDGLPFAHVFMLSSRNTMIDDADRLGDIARELPGGPWTVQATYSPEDGMAVLMLAGEEVYETPNTSAES